MVPVLAFAFQRRCLLILQARSGQTSLACMQASITSCPALCLYMQRGKGRAHYRASHADHAIPVWHILEGAFMCASSHVLAGTTPAEHVSHSGGFQCNMYHHSRTEIYMRSYFDNCPRKAVQCLQYSRKARPHGVPLIQSYTQPCATAWYGFTPMAKASP